MEDLIENDSYLVGMKNKSQRYSSAPIRIASFNGFGPDKGWGGMDWAGDSGHSTDSWMHDDVEWYLPFKKLGVKADGDTKQVMDIYINRNRFVG